MSEGIFIGSVLYRTIQVGFAESMTLFQRRMDHAAIRFVYGAVSGDALVSRSRSIVASAFLRSDCDVLLTIDSDIWFRTEDALRLVERCRGGHDLIGALYMTRNMDTQPASILPDGRLIFHAGAEPVEVPFLSTGFMAVHRKVFERVRDMADLPHCHQDWNDRGEDTSFWPFYMPFCIPWEGDGHLYLSEDWAFCQRAKDAGFTCWLDPSIRLGHYGDYMYTLEDRARPARAASAPLMFDTQANQLQTYRVPEELQVPIRRPNRAERRRNGRTSHVAPL
mgnify:CR=1 FL=1